jgi:DNA-binding transcriptional MerR regulator
MTDLKKQIADLEERRAALEAESKTLDPWKDAARDRALGMALQKMHFEIQGLHERLAMIDAGLPDPIKETAPRSTAATLPRLPVVKAVDAADPAQAAEVAAIAKSWADEGLTTGMSQEDVEAAIFGRDSDLVRVWNKAAELKFKNPFLQLFWFMRVFTARLEQFRQGARAKRIELERRIEELEARPSLHDAGVYEAGTAYAKGAAVSHSGSYWVAKADTVARPGESTQWRLIVKKGSNGKDADPRAVAERLLPEVEAAIAKHMKG